MAVKKGSAKAISNPTKTKPKAKPKTTQQTLSAAKKTHTAKHATIKKARPGDSPKKKAPARKAPITKRKSPARKITAVRSRFSKAEIISELAANSDLTRKQINTVLDELAILVERHVKKRSVGEFVLAGLIKIHTVKRPARKAYTGINPFTGEETTFKARPASVAVKVHALKGLKDMAQ